MAYPGAPVLPTASQIRARREAHERFLATCADVDKRAERKIQQLRTNDWHATDTFVTEMPHETDGRSMRMCLVYNEYCSKPKLRRRRWYHKMFSPSIVLVEYNIYLHEDSSYVYERLYSNQLDEKLISEIKIYYSSVEFDTDIVEKLHSAL